jgi:dynein heavy chain 2, cytosolic
LAAQKSHSTTIGREQPDVNGDFNDDPSQPLGTGLTDQLISKCISIRQPELEQKRIELLRNESHLFEQKQKLQDQLLEELSSAQGNILQNEKLISTLNHIKESTVSIEASLRESFRVRQELTKDFDKFKEICENSASLFMGITRIYSMNIATFLKIFVDVIRDDKNASFKDAFQLLVKLLFTNLSRSILKSEQIALGLNVAKQAFPNAVPDKEWDLFVFNFMGSSEGSNTNASLPSWMKKEVVAKFQTLSTQHPELYEKMQLDKESIWSSYIKSSKAQELPLQLTEFRKILISQLLRPDQLISTIIVGVERILGFPFLAISQPTIKQISEHGSTDEPILLLSAAGNDPSIEIREYAATSMGKDKFVEIAIRKRTGTDNYREST